MLAFVLLIAVALLSGACTDPSAVSWRGLDLRLPEGWHTFEKGDDHLSVADGQLGGSPGDPGTREAEAFFTYEPQTSPDDWRDFVRQVDGTLETDEQITLDGVPATRLVFRHASGDIPIREMVTVIPSRHVVVLMQPLVLRGSTYGPQRFLAHRDEFDAILDSIRFGAPVRE